MKWDIPINRVRITQMERYKGLCTHDGEEFYIVLSEKTNNDNKDFFATAIHELIHAKLVQGKHWDIAHKHGKQFKKLAKKIERKTNGFYTWKEITK
jgi:hypothetical protein